MKACFFIWNDHVRYTQTIHAAHRRQLKIQAVRRSRRSRDSKSLADVDALLVNQQLHALRHAADQLLAERVSFAGSQYTALENFEGILVTFILA